jgi:protein translocase SecG subunit
MTYALHILAWILFFVSAVLMTILILLQESKGGGLAEAFGGMGAETFGVKSGGINKLHLHPGRDLLRLGDPDQRHLERLIARRPDWPLAAHPWTVRRTA